MRHFKIRVRREDFVNISGSLPHDRGIFIDVSKYKTELAALPLTEQISGTSEFEILLRYYEAVVCLLKDLKPFRFSRA